MPDLLENTLADLHTLGSHPPKLRRCNTWTYKGNPNPAAGGGFTWTVPSDWWVRILTLGFTLTADATAQARGVNITYADADGTTLDTNPAIALALAGQAIPVIGDMQIPAAAPANASQFQYGTVTSPGAGAGIASIASLTPGLYLVSWQVELSGTLTAGTDNDNFRIVTAATTYARSVNLAVAATYAQQPIYVWVASGGSLNLQANAAATVGAVYAGSITATLVQPSPVQAMLPDITLKSGSTLSLAAVNFHSGDQLSAITFTAERFPSNWADGSLGSDEERILRHWIAAAGGDRWGM